MTTYTLGTSGRSFSSIANWEATHGGDDISVGGAEADAAYVVEVYNDASGGALIDEGTTATTLTITTDATNRITFRAASGNGANGAPNDHTTRGDAQLIDDGTKGAGFVNSSTFSYGFNFAGDITVENLQFLADGNRGGCLNFNVAGVITVSKSIVCGKNDNSNHVMHMGGSDSASVMENCLLIVGSSDRAAVTAGFADHSIRNCTGYGSEASGTTSEVFREDSGTKRVIFENCVGLAESQPCFETTIDAASTSLGSSDSTPTTPPTGSVSVSLTDGTDIRVLANSTSGDFRAVASGTLDGAGDSGSAATDDIYGTTRDASTPTLGCYELAAGGGIEILRRRLEGHA